MTQKPRNTRLRRKTVMLQAGENPAVAPESEERVNGPNNKIGWCDYTWNPITGCKRGCEYCYARKIRERFQPGIPYDKIIWHDERLEEPLKVKKPSRIFIGSMSDIEYWRPVDVRRIIEIAEQCPQHTFMFLTKNAFASYTGILFPRNCWLGQTVVTRGDYYPIQNDNLAFVSFEPLLDASIGDYRFPADWYIIGGLTPRPKHSKEAVDKILRQAEYFDIPVFIKDNARYPLRRKEFPE